jgi:hypothetical protein
MGDIQQDIDAKKKKMQALINARSAANCTISHSSKEDVFRETEIEDLRDEINALELKNKNK